MPAVKKCCQALVLANAEKPFAQNVQTGYESRKWITKWRWPKPKVFARALGMECSSEKSVARLRFLLLPGENAANKTAFPTDFEEKRTKTQILKSLQNQCFLIKLIKWWKCCIFTVYSLKKETFLLRKSTPKIVFLDKNHFLQKTRFF